MAVAAYAKIHGGHSALCAKFVFRATGRDLIQPQVELQTCATANTIRKG